MGGRILAGSSIGGMEQNQVMIDFSGKHNITADIELIKADYVNEAMKRMSKADVRYRFVIDVELDAISNVLKESQGLSISQFGYDETVSSVTSRLCGLDYDNDDRRLHEYALQPDACIEQAIQRQRDLLSVELNKLDAKLLNNVNGMQQLEGKIGPVFFLDYRTIIVPLLSSFPRVKLESLVDIAATETSDAVREYFLAEVELD